MLSQPKPIITVKDIRKALGKDGASLTEQQVEQLIIQVELMAEIAIAEIKRQQVVPTSP